MKIEINREIKMGIDIEIGSEKVIKIYQCRFHFSFFDVNTYQ